MPQTITNQANLSYQYNGQSGAAVSNLASATLTEPLSVEKNALEQSYQQDGTLTYVVGIVNSGPNALTNLRIQDDLGAYTPATTRVTPLTPVGAAQLYINGAYSGSFVPDVTDTGVSYTILSLPAGANAVLVYKVRANGYAPLATGSVLTNTVTLSADGLTSPVTATHSVDIDDYARVSILKSMIPATAVDGSTMTYRFTLNNAGNAEATDIVLSDRFDPAPSAITVYINGTLVPAGDYSYTGGLLTLPAGPTRTLSLPAATLAQDPSSGTVSVTPSSMEIVVTGTL